MLNQTKVVTKTATTRKTILIDQGNSTALSCIFSNSGVATVDGKKVIKAGTPLAGNLKARQTAFTVATTGVVGIAVHDVDVTDGEANGAVLFFGTVDYSKLDTAVQALITTSIETQLNMIKFVV